MWKSGSEITGIRLAECRLPGDTVLFLLAAVDNDRTNKGVNQRTHKSAKPSSNTAPDSADPRQHQADRSFIRQ
jgi:hypothetical protein